MSDPDLGSADLTAEQVDTIDKARLTFGDDVAADLAERFRLQAREHQS